MIHSTTDKIPGRETTEVLGIVRGSTVRARNVGLDITAAFKNLVGGEVKEYTKLQADTREQAIQRMERDAERLGADAIVYTIRNSVDCKRRGRNFSLRHSSQTIMNLAAIIWILFFVILGYFIMKRLEERKDEDFEQRDN